MRDRIPSEFLRPSGTPSSDDDHDSDGSSYNSVPSHSPVTPRNLSETSDVSSDSSGLSCNSSPDDIPGTSIVEPHQFSNLQRIVRPDLSVVTYKSRGNPESCDMIILNWTNAGSNPHVIVGDYAQYMEEMICVYDDGCGFEHGVVEYIVAFEIEVARRKSFRVAVIPELALTLAPLRHWSSLGRGSGSFVGWIVPRLASRRRW